jgi:hypothetical protein
MHDALKNGFPPFLNERVLRLAIESVCAKYGKVASLRILPPSTGPRNTRRCTCFLRLNSEPGHMRMMKELEGFHFGDAFAFFADVDEN